MGTYATGFKRKRARIARRRLLREAHRAGIDPTDYKAFHVWFIERLNRLGVKKSRIVHRPS